MMKVLDFQNLDYSIDIRLPAGTEDELLLEVPPCLGSMLAGHEFLIP
jgi:hypothetical protein